MNKNQLLFLACAFVALQAKDQSMFDAFYFAHSHGPADEQIFFATGTPDAWLEDRESERPLWSGIGFGMQNNYVPGKQMCWLKPNFTLGPAIPDPRGSFIVSVEAPLVGKFEKKELKLVDPLNNSQQQLTQKNIFPLMQSINASLTARGFFGPKSGFLKNIELVAQIATRIPWFDYLPQSFNAAQNGNKTIGLRSQNAFLIGINWHVVPPFLRVGTFYEAFSPRFYEEHFKGLLSKTFSFAKSTLTAGAKQLLTKVSSEANAEKVMPTAAAEVAADPELAVKFAGLACVGGFVEISLLHDHVQLGVRAKRVLPDVAAALKEYFANPGMQELCVYLKTGMLNNWSEHIDFPEVALNFAMLQDAKTKERLNSYGVNFKYRF